MNLTVGVGGEFTRHTRAVGAGGILLCSSRCLWWSLLVKTDLSALPTAKNNQLLTLKKQN